MTEEIQPSFSFVRSCTAGMIKAAATRSSDRIRKNVPGFITFLFLNIRIGKIVFPSPVNANQAHFGTGSMLLVEKLPEILLTSINPVQGKDIFFRSYLTFNMAVRLEYTSVGGILDIYGWK